MSHKRMNKNKKLLGALLAALFACGLFSLPALAGSEEDWPGTSLTDSTQMSETSISAHSEGLPPAADAPQVGENGREEEGEEEQETEFFYDPQPVSAEEVAQLVEAAPEDGSYEETMDFLLALPKWQYAIEESWLPAGWGQSEFTDVDSGAEYWRLVVGIQPLARTDLQAGSYPELLAELAKIEAEGDKSGTITLTQSFHLDASVSIGELTVTILGGGFTLTTGGDRHFSVGAGGTLALQNATLDGEGTGGGLYVNAGKLELTKVRIHDAVGDQAGGIQMHGTASLVMTDSVVDSCTAESASILSAHGIYAAGTNTSITMRGASSVKNCPGDGFGIFINQGALRMEDESTVENNGGQGVVLYSAGSTMVMTGSSSVRKNRDGGIRSHSGGVSINMSGDSSVSYNTSGTSTAGISMASSASDQLVMSGNAEISYNEYTGTTNPTAAGGVHLTVGTMTMNNNSVVKNNVSNRSAGGVYLYRATLNMKGASTISYNRAITGAGGGVYMQGYAVSNDAGTWMKMEGTSSIVGNYSYAAGGGIYMNTANNGAYATTAMFESMGNYHLIADNYSRYGGGGMHIEGGLDAAHYEYAVYFTMTYFSGNSTENRPKRLTETTIINNYKNHVEWGGTPGKGVQTKSISDAITPYAFNNYDIGWNGGAYITGINTVDFYVDGDFLEQKISINNEPVTEPAYTPAAGKTLDGWYEDPACAPPKWSFTDPVLVDMKLYAQLQDSAVTHTITIDYYQDSLSGLPFQTQQVTGVPDGDDPADWLPAGWLNLHRPAYYKEGVPSPALADLPGAMDTDLLIKVLYTPLAQNTVTFWRNEDQDDTVTHSYIETEGELVKAPIAPDPTGYIFDGWTRERDDPDLDTLWDFMSDRMPATPLNLYAQYTPREYKVTFDYTQVVSGAGAYQYKSVAYNTLIVPYSTTVPDYTFVGWEYGGGYWNLGSDRMPAQDITLVGVWKYTPVTTSPGTSSSSSGGGGGSTPQPSSSQPPRSTTSAPQSSSQAGSGAVSSSATPAPSSVAAVSSSSRPIEQQLEEELDYVMIFGNPVPRGSLSARDGWSLVNLCIALMLLCSGLVITVQLVLRRRKVRPQVEDLEEDTTPRRTSMVLNTAAIAAGVLPLALLPVLENFAQPMMLLSRWTPLYIAFAVVHIGLVAAKTLQKQAAVSKRR